MEAIFRKEMETLEKKQTEILEVNEGVGKSSLLRRQPRPGKRTNLRTSRSLDYTHTHTHTYTHPKNSRDRRKLYKNQWLRQSVDEIIAENLQNLEKEIDIQTQERFTTPNRHDQKRTASQCITVRMSKKQ